MNLTMQLDKRLTVFFLLFAILPFPLPGQSTGSGQSPVDQLIEQLALEQQLGKAPENIRMQFEQNPLNLAADKNELMLELFSDAYRSDRLLEDFKTALQQRLSSQQINKITNTLGSPPIQHVTEAHKEFYSLQGKRKRIVTQYEMEQQPPAPERVEIIQTLVDTTSAAAGSVESSIVILRSVIKALGNLSAQHSFTDQQIDAVAANFRTQMQAGASQQTHDQLMITYYNVDINTLESYLALMQSETGQLLDQAIGKSMYTAYERASDRFLEAVSTQSN
ncbi:hypothetical protein [Fodinibius sediminis]|uniref:DUF2059 domain-containing protein n=1 Tax=Fodinibius sediminis TaxID=1214077 RepID=A0A521DLN0_9BACT|nr:hypothetical protein [Fodinibius sediminis]SMO72617.1 hypothetical protein SAMN06265218_11124 [Fodinibius sediminis]